MQALAERPVEAEMLHNPRQRGDVSSQVWLGVALRALEAWPLLLLLVQLPLNIQQVLRAPVPAELKGDNAQHTDLHHLQTPQHVTPQTSEHRLVDAPDVQQQRNDRGGQLSDALGVIDALVGQMLPQSVPHLIGGVRALVVPARDKLEARQPLVEQWWRRPPLVERHSGDLRPGARLRRWLSIRATVSRRRRGASGRFRLRGERLFKGSLRFSRDGVGGVVAPTR
mmetsp:Transcript_115570/g.333873  ORF Transcript_115570/g.333873 Transcript_115570/m.333873 type:complete len:225 (-) Transcript_115570:1446-2120(-)